MTQYIKPSEYSTLVIDGEIARLMGQLRDSNPYPEGSVEHDVWLSGWDADEARVLIVV